MPRAQRPRSTARQGKLFDALLDAEATLKARRRLYGSDSDEVRDGVIELTSYCLSLSSKWFASGDDRAAVVLLEKVVELSTDAWGSHTPMDIMRARCQALSELGHYYERNGDHPAAKRYYERQLKTEAHLPEGVSPETHLDLANVLASMHDYQTALVHGQAGHVLARQEAESGAENDEMAARQLKSLERARSLNAALKEPSSFENTSYLHSHESPSRHATRGSASSHSGRRQWSGGGYKSPALTPLSRTARSTARSPAMSGGNSSLSSPQSPKLRAKRVSAPASPVSRRRADAGIDSYSPSRRFGSTGHHGTDPFWDELDRVASEAAPPSRATSNVERSTRDDSVRERVLPEGNVKTAVPEKSAQCSRCIAVLFPGSFYCHMCGTSIGGKVHGSARGLSGRKSTPVVVPASTDDDEDNDDQPKQMPPRSIRSSQERFVTNMRRKSVWDNIAPPSPASPEDQAGSEEFLRANGDGTSSLMPLTTQTSTTTLSPAMTPLSSGAAQQLALLRHVDEHADQTDLLWKVGTLLSSAVTVYEHMDFRLASARILTEARNLCDAQLASIFLVDGGLQVCRCDVFQDGLQEDKGRSCQDLGCTCIKYISTVDGAGVCNTCSHSDEDHKVDITIPYNRKGVVWTAAENGSLVNVQLPSGDDMYREGMDNPFTGPNAVIARNVLAVPLKARSGRVVAVIEIVNKSGTAREDCFDRIDEFLLLALAGLAGIALRNSRIYEDSKRTQDNMTTVLTIAKSLASTMDTTQLITKIMASVRDLLGADRCTLFLLDREKGELWSKIRDGEIDIRIPATVGIAGHCCTHKEVLNIPEAREDHRFNADVDKKSGYWTRTILCMPMLDRVGEVIGVTQVINKLTNTPFTEEDEALLAAFSAQAAVAIQNAKMFQRMSEMKTYLESILSSITSLVLAFDMEGRLTTSNKHGDALEYFLGKSEENVKAEGYRKWMSRRNEKLLDDMDSVFEGKANEASLADAQYFSPSKKNSMCINYKICKMTDFDGSQTGVVMIMEDVSNETRLRNTMSRYMSPALVQKVMSDGEQRLGGIRQKVTVLFCDIRGFTSLSEGLEPSLVVGLLNEYFSVMVNVILEEEGVLDKYIGDALMAVFGIPFVKDDDAYRACKSVIMMRQLLERFNEQRLAKGLFPIRNGIGISTGPVLCGNIGSERRLEYTVIGDHVNLASRLEGVTKVYKVNTIVTESTMLEVKDHFIFRHIDAVRVLGRNQAVQLYELISDKIETIDPSFYDALPKFQEARELYLKQNWDAAIVEFEAVYKMCGDQTAQVFVKRCHDFKANPPAEDWDGVWNADSK